MNEDQFSGILANGQRIPNGSYLLHLDKPGSNIKFVIQSSLRNKSLSDLSKQAALLGMADFFRFFLKTLIGIALARLLTPQDLGSYRQLFLIYSTLSGVLLLGFPQSLQYFLPKSSTHLERIRLITRTMNVVSGLGLICAAILWFGRQPIALAFNNPDLARLLPIYSIYPIFIFITQIYSSIMLGLKESGRSASFLIYAILCDLVIVLGVAVWSRDLQMIVLAVVFSALLQWLYAIWNLRKLNNGWDFANFKGFRTQLDYTIPLGLSLLVGVLSVQLDKLMISGFFNPEQFAVFSLGAIEMPLIGIIINSVNAILLPNIIALDNNSMSDIFSCSVRKNAILVFPLTVVFFIYAREFITFVYGKHLSGICTVLQDLSATASLAGCYIWHHLSSTGQNTPGNV
jgi:O-antigen/teichoic acid export membrane protein